MNRTKQPSKFKRFLRNNAALLLLIFCVLAITAVVLSVTLTRNTPVIPDDTVVNKPNDDQGGNKPDDDTPNPPSKEKVKIYFTAPLKYTGKSMDYTSGADNPFEYNRTLEVWAAHKAVDLLASEGTDVVAMYEGTVIDVGSTFNEGNYVVIDHGDNVIATYASLQNVQVQKNQKVSQGEVIGEVSISASAEYLDGAHLHLQVKKNNVVVDPTPYINGTVYREVER